jgi:hypothetical protein
VTMTAAPFVQAELRQTVHPFTLPFGYVDDEGSFQRHGQMRLATALDEVAPLADPRVQANQAYLSILLLSRVVVRLGDISPVPPAVIERLYSHDFSHLQDLYVRLNDLGTSLVETQCPNCGSRLALDVAGEQ